VGRPDIQDLASEPQTSSATVRERVERARARQRSRLQGTGASCNAELNAALIREHVLLDAPAQAALARAYTAGALSARGRQRVLRVARTVADLDGRELVSAGDVLTALALRQRLGDQAGVG
jgi:magnesium chelatase family protein